MNAGAAYLFSLAGESWPETRALSGADCCAFGATVALDGDTLAVSEPRPEGGAVYVFNRRRNGANGWGQVTKIDTPGTALPTFGAHLALDGDLLAVLEGPRVYIFERNRGGPDRWGEQRRIVLGEAGSRLALDGDMLAVIQPEGFDSADGPRGRVAIFHRNNNGLNAWGLDGLVFLSAGGRTAQEIFVSDLDLDGPTLAVTTRSGPGTNGTGAGYIFRFFGSGWAFNQRIEPTALGFGSVVALDGDTVAISSVPSPSRPGQILFGSVSLFGRHQGGVEQWGELRQLPLPSGAQGFGAALALNGDVLAVGAPGSMPVGAATGAVHLFERNIGGREGWGALGTLSASTAQGGSQFGLAVDLSGNVLAAGGAGLAAIFTNGVVTPNGLGLSAATNAPQPGEPVTVTATISSEAVAPEGQAVATEGEAVAVMPEGEAAILGMPQGEVAFYLNGEPAGTAQLDAQGRASLALPGLPQGTHGLIARFAGSETWAPCESPPLSLFVGVEPPAALPEPTSIYLPQVAR